ncbi:MAG: WecB/TagA/CpsF family glycosyltransferase [Chloroflexota bacterium]
MSKTTEVSLPEIYLLQTKLTLCTQQQLLNMIVVAIQRQNKQLVLSGNVYSFNLAYENKWLRDFLNQADVVRLDGAGLRLGAKILGISAPPRMTWADFAWDLAQLCVENDFSLYFLGGKPGVAERAAAKLQTKYPTLRLAGCHHGYFDKTAGGTENETVITAVNDARPDILLIEDLGCLFRKNGS